MTWKTLVGASALLLVAALLPATAYHIDPAMTAGAGATVPSDWTTAGGVAVITCESDGPLEDGYQSPSGQSLQGGGGLCRTGENDATGVYAPCATALAGPAIPTSCVGGRKMVMIDACGMTTSARNSGLGPYNAAGGAPADSACQIAGVDQFDDHHWTAQIGVFQCEVPTASSLPTVNPSGSGAWGLYYDNLYVWWTYEDYGDGSYTAGDPIDTLNSGDGAPNDDANGDLDNADDYHGHIAMFIDPSQSTPAAAVTGSAVTQDGTAYLAGLAVAAANAFTDDPGGTPATVTTNNCGSSPACAPGASPCDPNAAGFTYGPVIRAPN